MKKKERMGGAAQALFRSGTGAAALAAVASDEEPAPTVTGGGEGDASAAPPSPTPSATTTRRARRAPGVSTPPAPPASAAEDRGREQLVVANVRLAERHLATLRAIAYQRSQARGSSRMDTSEVLREILDEWMRREGR